MKKLISLLTGLLLTMTASASTLFCSPSGNGNGTSYQTPCSFEEGLSQLRRGGDTLYVLGGEYYIGRTNVTVSGNRSANVVISGYPGELAILDFRSTAYGTRGLCIGSDCNYVHIKDLTLRYSGKNNLYNEGSYCIFENLDIYGSADTGCQMKKGGNNLIKNVDSHDNFDYEHYGSDGADFGGNADGFADKQHNGAPNHYIGCRSWNNSDDGWDFFDRNTSAYSNSTIIEDCICYQNGPAEYDMQGHARYQTDREFFDNINGSTITNRYGQEQVVTLAHYPNHGNGNGFKLGGNYSIHNVTIHHCLSVDNTVKGFDQNNDAGTMRVYNCTGYMNGNDYGFNRQTHGTLYVQNCVSYQSRGANSFSVLTVAANDHNSWNTAGVNLGASDFASTDISHILDARDAAGNLPASVTSLFAPSSGTAKMVDKGTNVGLAYYGSAPDLGWKDWQTGTIVAPEEPEPEPEPEPYVCKEGSHRVAFVTVPDAAEDKPLLDWLRACDSLCVEIAEAADPSIDYSSYEMIILGPKPSSTAAGFTPLKGYDKPMLVLKPWLFKSSVWNWGTAVNTQDLSIAARDTTHPIFHGIEWDNGQSIKIFEQCNQNAVTAISDWTSCTGVQIIGSPVSHSGYSSIAEMAAGTQLNGTTLTQPMLMIGVSEYSTTYLTNQGKQLIINAVCYLLGMEMMEPQSAIDNIEVSRTHKVMENGHIVIVTEDGKRFSILGTLID